MSRKCIRDLVQALSITHRFVQPRSFALKQTGYTTMPSRYRAEIGRLRRLSMLRYRNASAEFQGAGHE